MKTFSLPCGKGTQTVSLEESHILYDLHGNDVAIVADEQDAVRQALRQPVGSAPLRDVIQAGDTVAIIVSDITRLVHTDIMLPVIVEELNSIGVKDEQITVITAQGTHRAHTPEEDAIVCGQEMAKRLRIVNHDCRSQEALTCIGTTTYGNDVYINAEAVKADKVILTGSVSSKNTLGTDYGMSKASAIGREWNEQAAAFAAYTVGKTADEVTGIAVSETGGAADADLAASCSIAIGGFQSVVAKAAK